MSESPTSIRLDKQLKDFLRRRGSEEGRTVSQIIIRILEQWRLAYLKSRKEDPQ
jgi:hypothetical protein